jgi:single-stranded DNA-binding protein
MINKVLLLGTLKAAIQTKENQYGSYSFFGLETVRSWVNKDGQKRSKEVYHTVFVTADKHLHILNKCHEGELLYLEGSINYRSGNDASVNATISVSPVDTLVVLKPEMRGQLYPDPKRDGRDAEEFLSNNLNPNLPF